MISPFKISVKRKQVYIKIRKKSIDLEFMTK